MLTPELLRQTELLRLRTRQRVQGLFAGQFESAFKGRGVEFAEVREYEPGDDVRAIDWNVTARTGTPHIKRFIEERELSVVVLADLSGSSAFSSTGTDKRSLSVETAATIIMAAALNRDRAGLVAFTDSVELFVPPRRGTRHAVRLLRELVGFEPASTGTSLAAALRFAGRMIGRRAMVFIVSDFQDEGYEKDLRVLARRHEIIALRVSDPRENALVPAGLALVRDAETGQRRWLDTSSRSVRARFAELAEQRHRHVAKTVRRCGADLAELSTDRPFIADLARHLALRDLRGRRR